MCGFLLMGAEPYNFKNLSNIKLEENNLVKTNQLDLKGYIYQYNNYVYEICPTTGASNSSYWISQAILKCIKESGIVFKVRLNPFIEIHPEQYHPMMYKMFVHGKPCSIIRK